MPRQTSRTKSLISLKFLWIAMLGVAMMPSTAQADQRWLVQSCAADQANYTHRVVCDAFSMGIQTALGQMARGAEEERRKGLGGKRVWWICRLDKVHSTVIKLARQTVDLGFPNEHIWFVDAATETRIQDTAANLAARTIKEVCWDL